MDRGVGGTFITRGRVGSFQDDSAQSQRISLGREHPQPRWRDQSDRLTVLVLALIVCGGLGCGCGLRPGLNRTAAHSGFGPTSPAVWNGAASGPRDPRRHADTWPRPIVVNPAEGLAPPTSLVASTQSNPFLHAHAPGVSNITPLQGDPSSRAGRMAPASSTPTPSNLLAADDPLPPPLPFPFATTIAAPSTILLGQTVTRHDLTPAVRQSEAERRLLTTTDDDRLQPVSFEPILPPETPPEALDSTPPIPAPPTPSPRPTRSQSRSTTTPKLVRQSSSKREREDSSRSPTGLKPETTASPTLAASPLPEAFQPPRFERAPVLPPLGRTTPLELNDAWQRILGPESGPFPERWRAGLAALNRFLNERSSNEDDAPSTFPPARRAIHTRMISWMREDLQRSASSPLVVNQEDWVRMALRELDDGFGLRIARMALCRQVEGFGNYEPIEPTRLQAGQTVILYAELMGVRAAPGEDEKYHSTLESRLEIVSIPEDRILWSESLGRAEDSCRRPRLDCFANVPFTPPRSLASGTYRLRLVLSDLVAGTTATHEVEFDLAANPSESPSSLQSHP